MLGRLARLRVMISIILLNNMPPNLITSASPHRVFEAARVASHGMAERDGCRPPAINVKAWAYPGWLLSYFRSIDELRAEAIMENLQRALPGCSELPKAIGRGGLVCVIDGDLVATTSRFVRKGAALPTAG